MRARTLIPLASLLVLAACDGESPTAPGPGPEGPMESPTPPPEAPSGDTLTPTLESVNFFPKRVNVTGQGALVTILADVADDGSGVEAVRAQFVSPSGAPITAFVTLRRIEGDARKGRWEGFLFIPSSEARGTWTLLFVQATDGADNTRTWNTDELRERAEPVQLQVTG